MTFAKSFFLPSLLPRCRERVKVRRVKKTFGKEYNLPGNSSEAPKLARKVLPQSRVIASPRPSYQNPRPTSSRFWKTIIAYILGERGQG
jgi:hypothetical protein